MRNHVLLSGLCALSCGFGWCAVAAPAVAAKPADAFAISQASKPLPTHGKFVPDYGAPCKDPEHEKLRQALKKAKYLETMTARINAFVVAGNKDVTVTIKELGTPNAYWSTERGTITLSYEIIDDFADAFAQEGAKGEELTRKILNATDFVLYHEAGHALIAQLGLPTTGREEDAVDQFATYLLLLTTSSEKRNRRDTSSGGFAAINAAKYFALTASTTTISERAFWDTHSLNQQRFFDILAIVYGSNTVGYEFLVKTRLLPAERAEGADLKWLQLLAAWGRLINPYSPEAVKRYDEQHAK